MSYLKWFICLWMPLQAHCKLEPWIKAHITASLCRRFYSGCVFLLHSSDFSVRAEAAELTKVRKILSELWVSSGMYALHNFNHTYARKHCHHNKPINVILDTEQLLKVSPVAVWLLFLSNSASLSTNIEVPFDSELLVARSHTTHVSIAEVYRTAPGRPINEVHFGNWTPSDGLISVTGSLVTRRKDLQGAVIRVVSTQDPPITTVTRDKKNVRGFFGDVWEILQQKMNFRTNLTLEDRHVDMGNCSSMLGAVQCGTADVALHAFATSSYSKSAVHFSMPLLFARYRVFIKKPSIMGSEWGAYLAPFSPRLWWVLLLTIVFISSYLTTLYNIGRWAGNEESVGPRIYGLYDSLLYVFGAFCQQGHEPTPRSMSCRFVFVTAYIAALVLMAAYSAALISSLTVYSPSLPFRDLEGLLSISSFQFGVVADSELNNLMMNDDGALGRVFRALVESNREDLPATQLEGLQRVCQGNYAFMTSQESILPLLDKVTCKILPLPFVTHPVMLSPAFMHNHPYQELFSYRLRQLQEGGVLHRLRALHWQLSGFLHININPSTVGVHLEAVVPLLVLLSVSIILSFVLVLAEQGWFTLSRRRLIQPRTRRNMIRLRASIVRHKKIRL